MVVISGLQKMSLIDYPGKVAAVVFMPHCNFRCPYCCNPALVLEPDTQPKMPEEEFFEFLEGRKKWLDGVAITGGEATTHKDLPEFIRKVKGMGFLVCLETNGTNPHMIEQLIRDKLVDYLAMDIKGPKERYSEITCTQVNIEDIQKSIDLIRNSGIEYEFRTTFVPGLIERADMEKMGKWLEGIEQYEIHKFVPKTTLDKAFELRIPYTSEELEAIADIARKFFKKVEIR
jgi:pyruvate formate lyase activating enzyme